MKQEPIFGGPASKWVGSCPRYQTPLSPLVLSLHNHHRHYRHFFRRRGNLKMFLRGETTGNPKWSMEKVP
jgi:hypothetical protein